MLDLSCGAQALTPSLSMLDFALSTVYPLAAFVLAACTVFISICSLMFAFEWLASFVSASCAAVGAAVSGCGEKFFLGDFRRFGGFYGKGLIICVLDGTNRAIWGGMGRRWEE